MMKKITISPDEHAIIADIREIAFGEIYEATSKKLYNLTTVPLTEKEAGLIMALREYKQIDKIVVHDNEPTAAEITGVTERGLKYLKKIRF